MLMASCSRGGVVDTSYHSSEDWPGCESTVALHSCENPAWKLAGKQHLTGVPQKSASSSRIEKGSNGIQCLQTNTALISAQDDESVRGLHLTVVRNISYQC